MEESISREEAIEMRHPLRQFGVAMDEELP